MTGNGGAAVVAEIPTIAHWSDGKEFIGTSGSTAPVTNPATGVVTGRAPRSLSPVGSFHEGG